MFTRILYPTDFSDVSKKTVEYVKKLKEAGTREVIIVHIIDEREIEGLSYARAWAGELPVDLEKKALKRLQGEAQKKLEDIEAELKGKDFNVRVRIGIGSPFKEILKMEDEEDVSAIVIGSHGKSNIKEMLLGSVSENVIRYCKKPVLVTKRQEIGIEMFTRILYPTDFSDVSKKALEYVKKLKEAGTREVVIVHIIDERQIVRFPVMKIAWDRERFNNLETELQGYLEKNAKEELKSVESELKRVGFNVKVIMRIGSPSREILRVEDEEDVSAIVIGSHGKSNIKEMFLGSVSENAIRYCKKPVLVVKR
jgi:nucleotide-binding universal stress UspA family protein